MVLTRSALADRKAGASSSEASWPHVDRLSSLPDDLLGLVFSKLQTHEDNLDASGYAFLQTCKAIHGSAACLKQITAQKLYMDEEEHGSIAAQLCTVPHGASSVSTIRIAASARIDASRGQSTQVEALTIPTRALAQALTQHAACYKAQQLQLQYITALILEESCFIGGTTQDWDTLMKCFIETIPNMVSLEIYATPHYESEDFPQFFLVPELHELKLRSLTLFPKYRFGDSGSKQSLNAGDCGVIGSIQSLTSLTLRNFYELDDYVEPLSHLTGLEDLCLCPDRFNDMSPLSSLTALTSLELNVNGEGLYLYEPEDLWEEPLGLVQMISGCTNLRELSLWELRPGKILQSTSLQQLEISFIEGNGLPRLNSLPNLKSLHVFEWKVSGNPRDIPLSFVLLQEAASSVFLSILELTLACTELSPCSLIQLPSHFKLPLLQNLRLENIHFEPQELARLACHFPNLTHLVTDSCKFSASSIVEVAQCFSCLEYLEMQHACPAGPQFLDGCAEAQRRRSNKHSLMINLREHFDANKGLMDAWASAASAAGWSKITLECSPF